MLNGKQYMLVKPKLRDILSIQYDEKKSDEIVEIISMHDVDQLEGMDTRKSL